MNKQQTIKVEGLAVHIESRADDDYISVTDIARAKNPAEPKDVVKNWLRAGSTIEFIGLWELIHNPNFKGVEFDSFKMLAGHNAFTLSPEKWISTTHAIGLRSKSGRYGGGTFAHKDIAFEFASWISAEFKLYLIKEFQRLKSEENERLSLGWDVRRQLTKINYRIHTDAIKQNLIPQAILPNKSARIYASEADVLNMALFGVTAKQWRDEHPSKVGNLRDYAEVTQLVVLANLESLNAELIKQGISQPDRLLSLNRTAIAQMESLAGSGALKKLGG